MKHYYSDIKALPPIMAVRDLQDFLNIGRRQVYELVHSEGFPVIRIGTTIKIPRDLFEKWLDDQVAYNKSDGGL